MATLTNDTRAARVTDIGWLDYVLSVGAVAILIAVLAALVRGADELHNLPLNVWAHLVTILLACALTPLMLLRRRGDRLHRRLGYVWVVMMGLTAAISFDIRIIMDGGFSPIHILSAVTLVSVPLVVLTARQHDHVRHRRIIRILVIGALLTAGFFTFPFNRLLGGWLFG
jgi:uncharacterized membrane protein